MNKRQEEILSMLAKAKNLKTADLAQTFEVSIETIRRDINYLKSKNLIKRYYGGIGICTNSFNVISLEDWQSRSNKQHSEKVQIAQKALGYIKNHSVIALDIGTTTYELSKLLAQKNNLTIITNSLMIATNLAQTTHRVYCVGGLVSSPEVITSGFYANEFLSHFAYVDQFFIGADGITPQSGITECNEALAEVKTRIGRIAKETIALIDHSKFNNEAMYKSYDLSNVNIIITDALTPKETLLQYEYANIHLVRAI